MDIPAGNVTRLLRDWSGGKTNAQEELWPIVYGELKKLAHNVLRHRAGGRGRQTTTALVHEAYLRLVGTEDLAWNDRGHFFAVAARAMRYILVDYARRSQAARHGGGMVLTPLEEVIGLTIDVNVDIVALDDALEDLKKFDPRQSRIVELSYFGGLTYEEVSRALDVSPATVKRELRTAKMWLLRQLRGGADR